MNTWVNLTELELAYLAGLLDGEGCFSFSDNGANCIRPLVQLIMTDEEIVNWVGSVWGAKVTQFARHRALPHHKPQFRVQVTGEKAVEFCKSIYPYLKVKKKQAELHIEWMVTKSMENAQSRNALRANLKARSHLLNDDRRVHPSTRILNEAKRGE